MSKGVSSTRTARLLSRSNNMIFWIWRFSISPHARFAYNTDLHSSKKKYLLSGSYTGLWSQKKCEYCVFWLYTNLKGRRKGFFWSVTETVNFHITTWAKLDPKGNFSIYLLRGFSMSSQLTLSNQVCCIISFASTIIGAIHPQGSKNMAIVDKTSLLA